MLQTITKEQQLSIELCVVLGRTRSKGTQCSRSILVPVTKTIASFTMVNVYIVKSVGTHELSNSTQRTRSFFLSESKDVTEVGVHALGIGLAIQRLSDVGKKLALTCSRSVSTSQSIGDKEVLLVRTIKEDTKDERTLYQTGRGLANTGRTGIVRSNSHARPWKLMGGKLVGVKGV